MFRRLIAIVSLGLAGTSVLAPAAAAGTSPTKHVSSRGVSLTYSTSLARSVSVADLPLRVNANGGSIPARAVIFGGYTVAGSPYFPPTIWIVPAHLSRYKKLSGVEGPDGVAAQVEQLRHLLRAHPKLSRVPIVPYVLPATDESELLASKKHYLRFANGTGISFVTVMSQPATPITNATPVRWEFRGITADGKYVVAAEFPIVVPGLANKQPKLGLRQQAALMRGWKKYVAGMQGRFDRMADSTYKPDLGVLDSVARSIKVSR